MGTNFVLAIITQTSGLGEISPVERLCCHVASCCTRYTSLGCFKACILFTVSFKFHIRVRTAEYRPADYHNFRTGVHFPIAN
jgi:hypothetical protein